MKKLNNKISITGIFLFCIIVVGFIFVQNPLNLRYIPDGGDPDPPPPPPRPFNFVTYAPDQTCDSEDTISLTWRADSGYGDRWTKLYRSPHGLNQWTEVGSTSWWSNYAYITYTVSVPFVIPGETDIYDYQVIFHDSLGNHYDTAVVTVNGYDDYLEECFSWQNIPEVWESFRGENVKVALFDSGLNLHEDLNIDESRMLDFTNEDGDDDPYTGEPLYTGTFSHGLACAGILTAEINDKGIVGAAPNVELYSIKLPELISDPYLPYAFANALIWAMNNDIDIISFSGRVPEIDYVSDFVWDAIHYHDIIFVAASGNNVEFNLEGVPLANTDYSAIGTIDDVICVGSAYSYPNIVRSAFSCWGGQVVDFVSFGQDMGRFLVKDDDPELVSQEYWITDEQVGTSIATPQVAGIIALMMAASPYLQDYTLYGTRTRADVVTDILKWASSRYIDGLEKTYDLGWGYIDANLAVSLAVSYPY